MDEVKTIQTGHAPAREEVQITPSAKTWIMAALMETLTLLGGLYWLMSAPPRTHLLPRVLLVVGVAVLGSAASALLVARSVRSRD